MRAVIQRVSEAKVAVDRRIIGEINAGLVVLLGIARTDGPEDAIWLADKVAQLRIFADKAGKMNRSLVDQRGQALVVSQFTLHARTRKGTRPSFNDAAQPEQAIPLYHAFVTALGSRIGPDSVATGEFGALMAVSLVNDGPVTIIVDTPEASPD